MNILICLNYNTGNRIIDFIREHQKSGAFEIIDKIIIVDNDSSNDDYEMMKNALTDCDVIKSPINGGFGKGNNFGFEYALSKYKTINTVTFANSDIQMKEEAIHLGIEALNENSDLVMVSPLMIDQKGVVCNDNAWKLLTYSKALLKSSIVFSKLFKNVLYQKVDTDMPISYVESIQGSLFIIKSKVFTDIGMFDEGLFLYHEEDVLAFKLRKYKLAIITSSTYVHLHVNPSEIKKYIFHFKESFKSLKIYLKNYQKIGKIRMWFLKLVFNLFWIERLIIYLIKKTLKG